MSASIVIPFFRAKKPSMLAVLLTAAALSAGCAQQQANGYYEPPGESTITDAQAQGSGSAYRPVLRAPSQLQIALKNDSQPKHRAAESVEDTATANVESPASGTASPPAATQNLIPQAQT